MICTEQAILDRIIANVRAILEATDDRRILQLYQLIRLEAFSGLELHM